MGATSQSEDVRTMRDGVNLGGLPDGLVGLLPAL